MTVATNRQPSGVVIIDGQPYFLAKNAKGAPSWLPRMFQGQEGDPATPRRFRWRDWSRGIGDSRGVFRGAVEYAENAYLGAPGRILPGPKITEIATANGATVMDIAEVTVPANAIIALGGTKAVEINPSTHAIASTNTLTGTLLSAQLFDEQLAIAAGDSVDYYIRDSAGAYAQNSIAKKARAFGLSGSDLVRGYDNTWSKCSAANITSVDNWSAELVIGDASGKVNQVFSHNRWDYVLKDEGLYTFDEDTSEESNVLTDLAEWKSAENRAIGRWLDLIFVCTLGGLYRYIQQGAARPVGIEEVSINENVLSGTYPTAFAALGKYGYEARYKASTDTTYICMLRRAIEGDASMGSPFTNLGVIDTFTGLCRAMRVSDLPSATELFYGAGANVRYFALSPDGLPSVYRDSGTITITLSPNDLGSPMTVKQFRGLELVGRNADATGREITLKASMDGGGFNAVGAAITALSSTYAERFWTRGTNDSGRVIQLQIIMANDNTTAPIEVRDLILNYEERPEFTPGAVVGLRLRDFDQEGDVGTRATAREQREAIEALMDGAIVQVTDIWGRTYAARLSAFEGEPTETFRGEELQVDIAFALRELRYA